MPRAQRRLLRRRRGRPCVAGLQRCEGDRLLATTFPRAAESCGSPASRPRNVRGSRASPITAAAARAAARRASRSRACPQRDAPASVWWPRARGVSTHTGDVAVSAPAPTTSRARAGDGDLRPRLRPHRLHGSTRSRARGRLWRAASFASLTAPEGANIDARRRVRRRAGRRGDDVAGIRVCLAQPRMSHRDLV
jgi:hypothetical protein